MTAFATARTRLGQTASALGGYAAIWIGFTAARSFAGNTLIAWMLSGETPSAERALFRGELPTIRLQSRFFDPNHLHWWDYAATGVHWSFFIMPHLTAVALWFRDPPAFRRWRRALALLLGLGAAIYALLPTDPPWLAPDAINSPASPTAYRVMAVVGEHIGGGFYHATYQVIGDSNPLAAMPSIHFAVTASLIYAVWRWGWRWRLPAIAYAAAMALALIYLGEHYVLDVLVGLGVTGYACVISEKWERIGVWRARRRPRLGRVIADDSSNQRERSAEAPAA